jgi:hypothetical protein
VKNNIRTCCSDAIKVFYFLPVFKTTSRSSITVSG